MRCGMAYNKQLLVIIVCFAGIRLLTSIIFVQQQPNYQVINENILHFQAFAKPQAFAMRKKLEVHHSKLAKTNI